MTAEVDVMAAPGGPGSGDSWKRKLGLVLKLAVTGLFLGIVSRRVEWSGVWQSLLGCSKPYFLLAILTTLALEAVVAYRLRVLIRRTEVSADFGQLLRFGFIAKFYGFFLPAGVGPALVKWYKVTRGRRGRLAFAGVTMFEQSLNSLQMVLFVVVPVMVIDDFRIRHLRPELLLCRRSPWGFWRFSILVSFSGRRETPSAAGADGRWSPPG